MNAMCIVASFLYRSVSNPMYYTRGTVMILIVMISTGPRVEALFNHTSNIVG